MVMMVLMVGMGSSSSNKGSKERGCRCASWDSCPALHGCVCVCVCEERQRERVCVRVCVCI